VLCYCCGNFEKLVVSTLSASLSIIEVKPNQFDCIANFQVKQTIHQLDTRQSSHLVFTMLLDVRTNKGISSRIAKTCMQLFFPQRPTASLLRWQKIAAKLSRILGRQTWRVGAARQSLQSGVKMHRSPVLPCSFLPCASGSERIEKAIRGE
jgi:hypothetical protein